MTGKVFDIRRFSIHDGDGIRTTIFLKGCPLHCRWCQNPEGISFENHLFHFKNKCIRCGQCVKGCPSHAIHFNQENEIIVNETLCAKHLNCIDICPSMAISLDCREMSVENTIAELLKDRVFFRDGGGVTISGGEPFFQFAFMLELLKELKQQGINTAVESSLYVEKKQLDMAMPYIDTLFADFKILDNEKHRLFTGVSNGVIQENLTEVLKDTSINIIIRTPLIPTFTATKENIYYISKFITGINPDAKYEMLNYNPLAQSKYKQMKANYCFEDNPRMFSSNEMKDFYDVAIQAGVKNLIRH